MSRQIYANSRFEKLYGALPLDEGIKEFTSTEVMEEDRERYAAFIDMNTLGQRIIKQGGAFIQQPFRLRTKGNVFAWRMVRLLRIPTQGETTFMFSTQVIPNNEATEIEKNLKNNPNLFF